ncbi:receptor-interacting serine/threonine-protein kinase 4-like isoform 1-T2 [Symphorus nematophorus]
MALLSHKTEPVGNENLEKWEPVASGGFGHVYKARHKDWGFDVAIKILRDGVCPLKPKETAVCEEANNMEKASCEFVLRVYGIYQGCPPLQGTHMQQGIVMEFMGRGCVHSLMAGLRGRPPWPLAFRLAHEVALGMNFLHSRKLMHHDLKPSNVLLNDDLKAKVADFGLSRVSTSALSSDRETTKQNGGSYKYMPPEAFDTSYKPVRDFDIYSYGILLWSIFNGKEPYNEADYSLVALKVPLGDRPNCENIVNMEVDGLKEMVDLMQRCWHVDPSKRPRFKEFLKDTESMFSKHKKKIHHAVHEALERLDSPTSSQHSETSVASTSSFHTPEQSKPYDTVDQVRFPETQRSSIQAPGNVSTKRMSDKDKAKFVDDNRAVLIQDVYAVMAIAEALGGMVHQEAYSLMAVTATSQEKMRLLYLRAFPPGGVRVKAAFYDALKEHHPELVERLGG